MNNRPGRLLVLVVLNITLTLVALPGHASSYDPSVCADYAYGDPDIPSDCVTMMESFPEPTVIDVPRDGRTLGNYTYWRLGPHVVNLYDAPNGNVVEVMPEGFNFAIAIDTSVAGWVQIQGGQWVHEADTKVTPPSEFRGVNLLSPLEHPFAWVMDNMYSSDYPGGPQSPENGRLMLRYDRVNLFGEAVDEDGWTWYLIGPDQWIDQRLLAIANKVERPEGVSGRWVAIDLYEQTLVAYEEDMPVFATLVSSGLPQWDTNEGIFEVWARLETDGMSGATGAPDAYALQSVPWTMYFDNDISLHGTYWHDGFGYRHSHGCVNLSISDAHYLFNWTMDVEPDEDGDILTYVYVYSSGEYGS